MESCRTPAYFAYYRFFVGVAGFLVTLCFGTLYAWGIFMPHLEQEFGWSRAVVTIPFTVASLVFAFGMVAAGRMQDLKGPRLLLIISAVLVLIGYGLSSLAGNLGWLIVTFGIIMGAAIATGYMAAVAGGLKWFPDIKGTATGILVGGFGAGAAVFGPVADVLIAGYGWRNTFLILAVIFSIVVLLSSFVIKNPPSGWKPAGWDPTKGTGVRKPAPEYTGYEFPFKEMLKTKQFKIMWIHYFLILCGGFGIVVHIRALATEFGGFSPAAATTLIVIVSAFNLFGRFLLSPLSDVIGRLKSFTIVGSLMVLATAAASLAIVLELPWLLYFTAIVGGTAFGGYLALSPAFTADMWGMKSVGLNYGGMFTAWGCASFAGPFLAGRLYDVTGTYVWAYFTFALLCVPAILMARLLVKPAHLKEHAKKIGLPSSSLAEQQKGFTIC